MLGQKKKFSRKEIKEDKLVGFYYQAMEFVENQKRNLLIGAGVIVLVIFAWFLYSEGRASDNEKANIELAKILPLYEQGAYLEAIEGRAGTPVIGLKKLVDEYGSSHNGEIAKIYLANSYFFLGKTDEALKYYEDFGGSSEVFQATAFAGIASCYEAKNNYEEAANYFQKAASVSKENVLNPQYLIFASANLIELNKKEEAKDILKKLKKDYVGSPYLRDVDKYLAQTE
ncbi:MAG: tetratricopeptide repeat protein [Ignavibacteriales bacterium]|nr:tetratricopeptide repeat protein [Ignavibacteriales bacterium]